MITREQAVRLKHGQMLHHVTNKNADGTPQRWRVTGKVQTWKTRPDDFKVPIRNGLKNNDYLTPTTADYLEVADV